MSDIDDLIDEVSAQIEIQKKEETSVAIKDILDEDDLVNMAIKKNNEVEKMADDAFKMFYTNLSRQTDHSSSSKEQMLEAIKVRVELNKTLVELAKVKKKQGNLGVLINTVPQTQVGVDINKLREVCDED